MLTLYDEVKLTRAAPGRDSKIRMLGLVLKGEEIAEKLQAELGAIPIPDTNAGRQAAKFLDAYARNAAAAMVAEENYVHDLPADITLLMSIRGLQRLELAILDAFALMTTAKDTMTASVPEMAEPFDNEDLCRELDALVTD